MANDHDIMEMSNWKLVIIQLAWSIHPVLLYLHINIDGGIGGRCYWTLYCAHCTCVLYHVMCRQCRHYRQCTLPLYTQYRCTLPRCRHSHDDGPLALAGAGLQSRQENMKQLTLNLWVGRERTAGLLVQCSAEAAGQSWVTRYACKVSYLND